MMSDLTIITGLSGSQGTFRETQEMMILEQVGQAWEKYTNANMKTFKTYRIFNFAINFTIRGVIRELIHFPCSDVDLFLQVF